MDERKRTRINLWMFPLGTVGRDMVYTLFGSFLLTYVLFTRTLTAAQLTAITAIMVASRVFDALNDPLMGNIIDRTRTRFGKFKPWMVIGILSTSLVVYAAFSSPLQGWAFIAFFGVVYFLYSIAYTMHDIAYWGMVASLGTDADDRNRFTSRATLFAGIGGTLASMLIPMFTTGEWTLGGSASTAYSRVALVICILSPLFMGFTIFGVQERRAQREETPPPVSIRRILSTITGNDQLMWIAVIFLIHQIGNGLAAGGLGATYIYLDFGYSGGLYSLFNTVGMLATAVLMITYPAISRRIRRKPLMRIMLIVSAAGYAVMLLACLVLPGSTLRFWGITAGYTIANFGQYSFYLMMMISIINTVEYNEYLRGTRDEAIITSLRPFLTKMGSAVILALTSLSYLLFDVTSCTNRISALENSAANGLITEAEKLASIGEAISGMQVWQTRGLFLMMTVLPLCTMALSFLLYRKHYKLDEDEHARICRELYAQKEADA